MIRTGFKKGFVRVLAFISFTLLSGVLVSQTYTPSNPITYNGQSNITIDGKSFTSGSGGASILLTNCTNVKIINCKFVLTKDIIAIQLQGCTNVEISGCYFENFRTGVYAVTCKGGIDIHCNSFKNIAGIYPRGQIVQFNKCYGAGNRVNYNILDHEFGSGDPEDLINMYGSYGTSADPIQIIGNKLRGGGPSKSGGGIMIGDDGGHDIRVENNILVDVGQYGIGCPAGYNMTILNNKIYGAQKDWTNVGLYVGLQGEINAGFDCTGNTIQVKNNQIKFYRKDGVLNGWYNCSCCPGVVQSGNDFKANIDASILPTVLKLDENNCPLANPTPALSCNILPQGYESVYCKDFETTSTAGNYLKTDAWYFYWGGTNSTNYTHTELDKRFLIKQDPKNPSNKVIHLIKFDGDKDYSGYNPPLNPRTELSFRPSVERSTSKEIYFRIRTYFPASQNGVFSAEFIQFWLHGGTEEIPLQIEVRDGNFAARNPRTNGYKAPFAGKLLSNYLEQWITWEVKANFSNTSGYWKIYMNGDLVFTHTASIATWPGTSGTWHPQFGAYANNGGAGTMEVLFDDFMVAEYNGSALNIPPVVSLDTPTANANFIAPATIIFGASASDQDGTIAKVEYYNGSTKLSEDATSPFTFSWTGVAEGTYTVSAKAIDNKGAASTLSSAQITVTNPVEITRLKLIDATTELDIPDLDSMPSSITFSENMLVRTSHNIYADVLGKPDSVVFTYVLNGVKGKRKEGVTPYALRGDGAGYQNWLVSEGTYTINAKAYKLGIIESEKSCSFSVKKLSIPGTIEAEYFDAGGEGIAYHDIETLNQGKQYRLRSGVDIQECTQGGYNVGWTKEGEYLKYTVSVQESATYRFLFHVASAKTTGMFNLLVDGAVVWQSSNLPNTGAWQTWDSVESFIPLTSGNHVLSIEITGNDFNFDKIVVSKCQTQTIQLNKGWNLISINIVPTDNSISTIFNGLDVRTIKTMNDFWYKDQPDYLNTLQTITPGDGYLVYMNAAGVLTIEGVTLSHPLNVVPKNSWQLIGYPGCTDAMQCPSIPFSQYFDATNCRIIKNFDGFWLPNGTMNSIQNFEAGKGYFIK